MFPDHRKIRKRSERKYKFRAATLDERKEFYEKEFSIKKVKKWFKKNRGIPQLCAIDAGSETGIMLNKKWKDTMFYFPFKELRKKIRKYCPEDLYYDRNTYKNPNAVLNKLKFNKWQRQELVFDIDLDNIKCSCKSVCYKCIQIIHKQALKMKKELEEIGFKKILIVYSGRGFHVHVLDKKAFLLAIREREKLNKKFRKFPIDPWVSRGYIRLIRMPYSLHGIVSRICYPLKETFNKRITIPKFLKH